MRGAASRQDVGTRRWHNIDNTAQHYKRPSTTRRCFSGKGPCILASIFRGAFILVSFLALNFGLGILLRGPLLRRPPAKSSTTLAMGAWPVRTRRSSTTVAFGASLAGAARSFEPSNKLRYLAHQRVAALALMENTVAAAFGPPVVSVRAGLRGVVVPFEVPGADHLAAVHLLYMSMVTIEAVPGRGPLASAPVLEDVVLVAVAVGTPPLRAIVAASNAIRTAPLSTASAYSAEASTRKACE